MAAPISRNKRLSVDSLFPSAPSWAHPDYLYYFEEWQKLRDAAQGERAIKDKAQVYLKCRSGMDDETYEVFLQNATYYNMTARTIGALVGTIFKRNPVVSNLPEKLTKKLKTITRKAKSMRTFSRICAQEVLHMGRYGVLVDRDNTGDPYLTGYITESIVDWDFETIDSRERLKRVVLLEVQMVDLKIGRGKAMRTSRQYAPMYRELILEDGVYKQNIYRRVDQYGQPAANLTDPDETIIPTNRGQTFDYIPFVIISADGNSESPRSPTQDIVDMNLSHYRSYAELEHGRFFTGNPVFYVSKGAQEGAGEYTIGSSVVWEVGDGQSAGIIEYNGHGLNSLENAISTKEAHIATLGGRLIGVASQSVSESDNQLQMKDRNEQALLLNVSLAMDEGLSLALQWWAEWMDTPSATAAQIEIEFNKEFLLKESGAREFRAIQQMYDDGLLPVDVVYDYLLRADVIPDYLTFDEFKKLLESKNSFPNNPDVAATQEGFPDAKTKVELEHAQNDPPADQNINDPTSQRVRQAQTPAKKPTAPVKK